MISTQGAVSRHKFALSWKVLISYRSRFFFRTSLNYLWIGHVSKWNLYHVVLETLWNTLALFICCYCRVSNICCSHTKMCRSRHESPFPASVFYVFLCSWKANVTNPKFRILYSGQWEVTKKLHWYCELLVCQNKGIPNGFPSRIASFMHAGYCEIFGKRKKSRAALVVDGKWLKPSLS